MKTFLVIWIIFVCLVYLLMLGETIYYNRRARLLWKTFTRNMLEEED